MISFDPPMYMLAPSQPLPASYHIRVNEPSPTGLLMGPYPPFKGVAATTLEGPNAVLASIVLASQGIEKHDRHLERRLPVSGLECCPACHPERSEGSLCPSSQILRFAQDDRHSLQMSSGSLVDFDTITLRLSCNMSLIIL